MSKKDILIIILLNLIWGSAFAVAGYGLQYFSTIFLYFLRFFIVGITTIPFLKFPKENIKKILLLSFVQSFVFYGVALAVKNLDSSISAIVTRLDIIFTIVLASIIFKEKISFNLIFGILICCIAIFIISGDVRIFNIKYIILLIAASFASGLGNVISKSIKNESNLSIVSWNSFFMGIELFIISFFTENKFIVRPLDFQAVLCVLYLSIFSSYIAYVILYYLLRNNEASKIMPYNFLRPVISIFAGFILLSEPITLNKVLGTILIILGIIISQYKIADINKLFKK